MTARMPPTLAMWLLRHLGSGYQGESLAGDLFEEYQHGRTSLWYWRQSFAAIFAARVRSVRTTMLRFAAPTILRLLAEVAIILAIVAVAGPSRQICSLQALLSPTFIITLSAVIALAQAVGHYLSQRRSQSGRKQSRINRLIAAFALSALSAGTLTWAGTTSRASCVAQMCSCQNGPIAAGVANGPTLQRTYVSSRSDPK
jgi:hypothetical protein